MSTHPGIDVEAVRTEDNHAVVTVRGELDAYTAPRLREVLIEVLAERPEHLLVDLAGVPFMDSTALGVLGGANRRATASRGRLTVIASARVRKIMSVTGLDRVFGVVDAPTATDA